MKEKVLRILRSNTLFAFALNAVFLALCVITTSFTYEGSADFYNSVRICRDHLYVNSDINYLLASLIGTLQYAFPGINCFVLFEVLASYAAFVSVTFVFAEKYNKRKSFVFATLLNIMFALHHYTNVDSTRTAALLCAAGFLLMLLAIYNKRYSLSCWVGVIEIIFGSFLNIAYFFIALGFGVAFYFGDMIAKNKYRLPFRKFYWYSRPFMLMFLLATVLSLGLHQFSYTVNHATEESGNYYEYSMIKNSVKTLPFPGLSDHEEEFEEAGIDKVDYEMLKYGYYDADGPLNTEALKAVHNIQLEEKPVNLGNTLYSVFSDNYDEIMHFGRSIIVISVYLIVSVLFILYHKNRFSFFPLFYMLAGYISSFVLRFFYNDSSNVTYGVWLFMIMMLFNSFNFEMHRRQKPASAIRRHNGYLIGSCSVIAALAALNGILYYYNRTEPPEKNSSRFLFSELDRNPDCYYVMDPQTKESFIKTTENYLHPMWGFKEDYLSNLDDFGYLHNDEALRRRFPQNQNIYHNVLTGRKVFVIDNGVTFRKERYFTKHYSSDGKRAEYEPAPSPNGFSIYKVTLS